jgi:hypothetical protein
MQVKVTINGFVIDLPIGLKQVVDTPVRDSYQDFLQKDTSLVRRHLTALTTLLPNYLSSPKKVLHVFGGVGATAQVIDQHYAGVEHEFWERDPVLVEYLTNRFPNCKVRQTADSYRDLVHTDVSDFDCIMFDPSVGTIKTPLIKPCWARMAVSEPNLIWVSDTACAKIHLNYKTYEKDFGQPLSEPTAEEYLEAYHEWLLASHNLYVADAMREAAETYFVVLPVGNKVEVPRAPYPIPYL